MIKLPIALGLYSVRDTLFKDLDGTLAKVKEMGYDGVEFYGPFSYPPQTIRNALVRNGLHLFGWHVSLDLLQGVNLDATVAYMKAIGNNTLAVPYLGGDDAPTWQQHAQQINAAAILLKEHGMSLGYHNHAHEFNQRFGGKTPWNILFENVVAEVFPQLDTGNAMQGGADVLSEVRRFAGRLKTIHYKPYKSGAADGGMDAMFGCDDHDLPAMVAAAEEGGAVCHIIEYECEHTYSQFGGAREAIKAFRAACG